MTSSRWSRTGYDTPFARFHEKLSSLTVCLANIATERTEDMPKKHQEWALVNRVNDILQTGELIVGASSGFKQPSAFLHLGCAQCAAAVHISCPYLSAEGSAARKVSRTGAIDWHLANFLFEPGQRRRRLTMCSAEQAAPGAKLGDNALY